MSRLYAMDDDLEVLCLPARVTRACRANGLVSVSDVVGAFRDDTIRGFAGVGTVTATLVETRLVEVGAAHRLSDLSLVSPAAIMTRKALIAHGCRFVEHAPTHSPRALASLCGLGEDVTSVFVAEARFGCVTLPERFASADELAVRLDSVSESLLAIAEAAGREGGDWAGSQVAVQARRLQGLLAYTLALPSGGTPATEDRRLSVRKPSR